MSTSAAKAKTKAKRPRLLLVDDNDQVRSTLESVLRMNNFQVTTASNVSQALALIARRTFDVLLSDLHMPGPADGFTVVSAMRHTNPNAVTLLFTGYPALEAAMKTILAEADEVLVKPMPISDLVTAIHEKLDRHRSRRLPPAHHLSTVLEREAPAILERWLSRMEEQGEPAFRLLPAELRLGNMPALFDEMIHHLPDRRSYGDQSPPSRAAFDHGVIRYAQGFTVPMLVEESRAFQSTIFRLLLDNLSAMDYSSLVIDLLAIPDEVTALLKTTIVGYTTAAHSCAAA